MMPQPSAGGGTPDGAWNRAENDSAMPMEMAIEEDDRKQSGSESHMKVISGEDGRYVQVPNLCTPEYCIKIGLTLYKVQQNIYLLDFQKMTGDAFSFMTLCANIITELKMSAASKQQQAMLAQQQTQQPAAQQSGIGGIMPPAPGVPPQPSAQRK
jgi:hypothetical protein